MNIDYPIIDADGHVMEKDAELREFLEGRYREGPHFQTYSFFPSLDVWNRGFGVPGKIHETPASKWLEFLDEPGAHVAFGLSARTVARHVHSRPAGIPRADG